MNDVKVRNKITERINCMHKLLSINKKIYIFNLKNSGSYCYVYDYHMPYFSLLYYEIEDEHMNNNST